MKHTLLSLFLLSASLAAQFAPSGGDLIYQLKNPVTIGGPTNGVTSFKLTPAANGADLLAWDGAGRLANVARATFAAASHEQPFSTITSRPTTLAGYGITDALTAIIAATSYQPLDSDLSAIAALTTTSYGRGLLTQPTAAQALSYLGVTTGFDTGSITINGNLVIIDGNGITAPAFSGDGAFLTGLNASNISSGTLNVARIADGSITNAKLANSSITINGSPVALGQSVTVGSGLVIGTSTITGGTSGRLLTSGATLGELALGSGVSAFLAAPTLANLNAATTDADALATTGGTMTGALVFNQTAAGPVLSASVAGVSRLTVTTTAGSTDLKFGVPSYSEHEFSSSTWIYRYAGGERCRIVMGELATSVAVKAGAAGVRSGLYLQNGDFNGAYLGGDIRLNNTVGVMLIEPLPRDTHSGYVGVGHTARLKGGDASSAAGGAAGGLTEVSGGDAKGSGNNAGGDVKISGGAATGTGSKGGVYIDLNSLPTADPGQPGRLWRDGSNNLKVSP